MLREQAFASRRRVTSLSCQQKSSRRRSKIESAGLITAFGQACAYRLFSHKSYIVVPVDSPEDDIGRLDALARIFGIGLFLFDAIAPKEPKFEIRVRAAKHDPDMFYVNRA